MSFDAEWLDLREPADHAARDAGLKTAFVESLSGVEQPRIIDLGSGTGSTHRALAPLIPAAQWLLTDNDPRLLVEAKRRAPRVRTAQVDLSRELSGVLAREADALTASALIDLVSADWLDDLVRGAEGRGLYIALSYDGTENWFPPHPDDAEIFSAFQRHQRGDKGFGPALGSEAVPYLAAALKAAGYSVRTAPSPWRLTAGPLVAALAEGVATAAQEAGIARETAVNWLAARRQARRIKIGHLDLFASAV